MFGSAVVWEPSWSMVQEGSFFWVLMISVDLALSAAWSFEKFITKIDKRRFRGLTPLI